MIVGGCARLTTDHHKTTGEKAYHNAYMYGRNNMLFTSNPYINRVVSPYGYQQYRSNWAWGYQQRPVPKYHARAIHQTISLNNQLNRDAQASIDAKEPQHNIWKEDELHESLENMHLGDKKRLSSIASASNQSESARPAEPAKSSKLSSFRKSIGIKSSEERAVSKVEKGVAKWTALRNGILAEEDGRWPDEQWRELVMNYQAKVGMSNKIAELRDKSPTQYLHLLRAGYFEPIPVAWANQNSNPLKFSIEVSFRHLTEQKTISYDANIE